MVVPENLGGEVHVPTFSVVINHVHSPCNLLMMPIQKRATVASSLKMVCLGRLYLCFQFFIRFFGDATLDLCYHSFVLSNLCFFPLIVFTDMLYNILFLNMLLM